MHPENVLYYIDVLEDKHELEFYSVDELVDYLVNYQTKITPRSTAILLNHVSLIDKWTISLNDIKDMELISNNGYFGEVYKASWNNREVSVKTCKPTKSQSDRHQFLHGIEILKQCEHVNIVKVFGVAEEEGTIYSVKEMMSGGTLLKFLREKKPNSFKEKQLTEMCTQVCAAMTYLEEKNHIFYVLGACNCLVSGKDHNIIVKVINIGLCREETEVNKAGYLTRPRWTAPEVSIWICNACTKLHVHSLRKLKAAELKFLFFSNPCRLLDITDTPVPVMCGVLVSYCGRHFHLVQNLIPKCRKQMS